ncbi:unnamed protein product [Aspergillus oryzae var. brunneus]|uniref:Unnamed protein product n=1 Tax=Aspergillus oryzae var. brunneus TaxID=332754 RepID=A0ABQ6KEY3_ASPOZ|nr:unnamed protein product [Aspergillus oryzae var. brunneus]
MSGIHSERQKGPDKERSAPDPDDHQVILLLPPNSDHQVIHQARVMNPRLWILPSNFLNHHLTSTRTFSIPKGPSPM